MAKSLLSSFRIEKIIFPKISQVFKKFETSSFKSKNKFLKYKFISEILFDLIEKEKKDCFLLSSVLDFIEKINEKKIYEGYTFSSFEQWLNQFSNLDFAKNYKIRAKIAGKYVSRDDYQNIFPIGMKKIYEGSHFVTAHRSPDLDSTIASFWGWLDSFAARVSKNLHFWNVPGGAPHSSYEIEILFNDVFGKSIFDHLMKKGSTLTLTSYDIMTQEQMIRKNNSDATINIETFQRQKAVVITDDQGHYLGDWRSFDVEGVRQIIMLLNNCLRWFENNLHISLISLFAKKKLKVTDIPKFISKLFRLKIKDCDPAIEFSDRQKQYLNDYLEKVLGVKNGLRATFDEFAHALYELSVVNLSDFHKLFSVFQKSKLFDKNGNLIENRPQVFLYLEKIIKGLNQALLSIRSYVERIDVALKIKTNVFGFKPHYVSPISDIEEIRMKIGSRSYLTVNISDKSKKIPIGIVKAIDIKERFLGSVSFRDFCNFEEIKIASYLQVISIFDHHKSQIKTTSPALVILSDAQATNTIMAEQAILINDQYSLHGIPKKNILEHLKRKKTSSSIKRNLLLKKQIIDRKSDFYIHPQREFIEYLHFLYAILDDTDLLMKVSQRDVSIVVKLLNRMKSISEKKEVEIISLEDVARDENFVENAAKKILQNEDMYSLYKKAYLHREKEVKKNIELALRNKSSNFFSDVKEQNGCNRISQTKMFVQNIPYFEKKTDILRKNWIDIAQGIYKQRPEIDLHLHMISTIRGAKEVYQGKFGKYDHKDQLWIWIAPSQLAKEHLKSFLTSFSKSPEIIDSSLEVEFLGKNANVFEGLFSDSFIELHKTKLNKNLPMAVIYYNAGLINSRKSMISPYLPNLIS